MNESLFMIINSWVGKSIWLDRFMIFSAEWLGYFLILLLFVPLFLTFLINNDRISGWIRSLLLNHSYYKRMIIYAIGSAIAARFIFVEAIRFFYYHPRPFLVLDNVNQLVSHETTASMPSGHASFYFALAMSLYLFNKKAGYIFLIAAALISFARVFVGVHWPLDVIVGAGVGISTALILRIIKRPRRVF